MHRADRSTDQGSPIIRQAAHVVDSLLNGAARFSRSLARLSGALVVVMALMVSAEVALRKLTSVSTSFTHELSGYTLAIVTSLSLAYALVCKTHIRIDVLYLGASVKVKRVLDLFAITLMAAFSILLAHASWTVFILSYSRSSVANTSLGTPLWIPQSVWVFGFVFFAAVAVLLLIRVILGALGANPERADQWVGAKPESDTTI